MKDHIKLGQDIRLLVHLVILFLITLTGAFISIAANTVADEEAISTETIEKPAEANELAVRGKSLFKANCASCHNMNMKSDMTGPALSGAYGRWDNDVSEMTEFIRNPNAYLETKADKRLKDLSKKVDGNMQAFPDITEDEVRAIVEFVETGN